MLREEWEQVEEMINDYRQQNTDRLMNTLDLSVEQLYDLRGKVRACRDIHRQLSNVFGYE